MSQRVNVLERYSAGAESREESLCCPVSYDREALAVLPQEIIEKDYGCGDPSAYVREGDVVLDLGSGGGKICYIAAQLVGEQGRVIGVDMNDQMLALARKYQKEMAKKLGGHRVEFHKGRIDDLALNLDAIDAYLRAEPVSDSQGLARLESFELKQKREAPLLADESVDLVLSNCVLNLVDGALKARLAPEIFRVLRPGGRVAISDIVSNVPVPEHMQQDAELWSGCISGSFQEREFLDVFAAAGFRGVSYEKWDDEPWRVVEGIEFRSVTLVATKPSEPGRSTPGTVLYRGPYSEVCDEDGNHYPRGERVVVSGASMERLINDSRASDFVFINENIGGGECCSGVSVEVNDPPDTSPGGGCC